MTRLQLIWRTLRCLLGRHVGEHEANGSPSFHYEDGSGVLCWHCWFCRRLISSHPLDDMEPESRESLLASMYGSGDDEC